MYPDPGLTQLDRMQVSVVSIVLYSLLDLNRNLLEIIMQALIISMFTNEI